MNIINELDKKYAKLLLCKCLSFKNTDTLLIEYMTHEHDKFVKCIIEEAKKIGVKNIFTSCNDSDEIHSYLVNNDIENIKLNPIIDRSIWDDVSKKHGCILHINTFIPNLMNDIDSNKILKMNKIVVPTFSYYRANNKYNFPWVICAYPNKRWAEYVFKSDSDSYMKLYNYIMKICMINTVDPIVSWNTYIEKLNQYRNKLQEMKIKKLHYKNSLGTDFEVGFPKDFKWIKSNFDKVKKSQIVSI